MPNVFISSFSSPSLSGPCHKTPACDIQQGTATPGQDISAASKESSFRCRAAPETYLLGKLGGIAGKVQMFLWSQVTMQGSAAIYLQSRALQKH